MLIYFVGGEFMRQFVAVRKIGDKTEFIKTKEEKIVFSDLDEMQKEISKLNIGPVDFYSREVSDWEFIGHQITSQK